MTTVKVQLKDGTIAECSIEISTVYPWKVSVYGLGMDRREFVGDDLFDAQISLRKEVEAMGCRLLCVGARSDVYPSGMSRSMSGGRTAYVNRLGAFPTKDDLVDIFAYAAPDVVGSIEQQRNFHAQWVGSLRR